MRIGQFCVAILLIGAVPYVFAGTSAPVATHTVFQFVSAPGDYIGQGQTVVLDSAQATFVPRNTGNVGYVAIDVSNFPANGWNLGFSTATGSPLTIGSYADATGPPFQNGVTPGMSVEGDGRGCDRYFGHFDILDIAYDPVTGALSRFAANFFQRCQTPTAPVLVGAIRFNSSVPVPEFIIPLIGVTTPLNNHGCVEATSPAGGVALLSASAAGGANLKYTWAASNGSKGIARSIIRSGKSGRS